MNGGTVAHDLLTSVAAFLRRLADAPAPERVADALVECFRDTLSVRMAAILPARAPVLVVFATSGYEEKEVQGFDHIALDHDYPATRAFHESEIVIDPMAALRTDYAGTARAESRVQHMIRRIPDGTSIAAPIIGGGRTLGAYSLVCAGERTWTTLDLALVSTIGHALGMWLLHPDSGLPDESTVAGAVLTPRQVEILSRLPSGMTNAAIAAELHCSESTVKVEIGRILRALGVGSREAAAERAVATGVLPGRAP